MLNVELFKEFGEESRAFFTRFSQMFSDDVLSKCYAMRGTTVHSGNLHAPGYIGVCADSDTVSKVYLNCLGMCVNMSEPFDENDTVVRCLDETLNNAERDGIKIWV